MVDLVLLVDAVVVAYTAYGVAGSLVKMCAYVRKTDRPIDSARSTSNAIILEYTLFLLRNWDKNFPRLDNHVNNFYCGNSILVVSYVCMWILTVRSSYNYKLRL